MELEKLIEQVVAEVLKRLAALEDNACTPADAHTCADSAHTLVLDKRVVTERDIRDAHVQGYKVIHLKEKAIVTLLARDYATQYKIELL